MQFATYGGKAVPGYIPATHTHGPQTILKGIVGPLDITGQPKVFQFINRVMPNGTADDTIKPDGSHTPEYTGVVVNLEVKRHQMQVKNRQGIAQTPIGIAYGHGGFFPGYLSLVLWYPRVGICLAIQVNSSAKDALARPLRDVLLEAARGLTAIRAN